MIMDKKTRTEQVKARIREFVREMRVPSAVQICALTMASIPGRNHSINLVTVLSRGGQCIEVEFRWQPLYDGKYTPISQVIEAEKDLFTRLRAKLFLSVEDAQALTTWIVMCVQVGELVDAMDPEGGVEVFARELNHRFAVAQGR
ncbi:hypothetical protein [Devriesea agamarum]|uniref:hypothetical protein n=1 Tax=Devriesea agamarum TaxID=472569 RepID=UPI0012EE3382|nr:hypothetical protein [Devriesea agamarum]